MDTLKAPALQPVEIDGVRTEAGTGRFGAADVCGFSGAAPRFSAKQSQ